ncbi:MAG: QueT transporter family protein [Lactobacillales bacterium]|jgi:uncharacterized membrane protein|nr:QueT transporter family protein [Lactobacillales bacterium]
MEQTKERTHGLVRSAIVIALYIAITVLLGPLGNGAIQFRLSEMFNYLALKNKRYIWALTVAVAVSNYIMPNSLGVVDVVVGSLSTLIFVSLGRYVTRNIKNETKRFFFFNLFFSFSMFTIAGELHYMLDLPFFLTWLTCGLGEFISLLIGGWVIQQIGKRVDLTK